MIRRPRSLKKLSDRLAAEVDMMPEVFEGMLANQLYFEIEKT